MKKTKCLIVVIVTFFSFFILISGALAGSAVLTWNDNSERDLASYKIYYATATHAGTCPTGYDQSVVVADDANSGYWFDALTPGQTYYFQVTAIDTSNNESTCSTNSGEVSKLITYRGDITGDGNSTPNHIVNMNDFTFFADDYGKSSFCGTATTNKADIDRDCFVNMNDFTILSDDFGDSF